MPRRGENIYKRKDGRWEGRYIRGRTPAGKAEYGYVYAKSYAACREKRRRMEDALPQKPMLTGEMSVCQAAEFFLSERRGALKASTIGRYEYMIRHYISAARSGPVPKTPLPWTILTTTLTQTAAHRASGRSR